MTPNEIKKLAEQKFVQAVKVHKDDAFLHRLTDTSDIRQRAYNQKGVKSYAHAPKNPADYIVTFKGKMFYAEVKGTSMERFHFSRIEPSQKAGMIQQVNAKGAYYVFVYDALSDFWFRLPAWQLLEWMPIMKSISLNKLHQYKEYICGTDPLARLDT